MLGQAFNFVEINETAASASGTACHCHALCIWPLAVVVVVLSSFWVARPPPKYIILPHRSIRYSFCFEESNTTHKLTKRCKHFIIEVFNVHLLFEWQQKHNTNNKEQKNNQRRSKKKRNYFIPVYRPFRSCSLFGCCAIEFQAMGRNLYFWLLNKYIFVQFRVEVAIQFCSIPRKWETIFSLPTLLLVLFFCKR